MLQAADSGAVGGTSTAMATMGSEGHQHCDEHEDIVETFLSGIAAPVPAEVRAGAEGPLRGVCEAPPDWYRQRGVPDEGLGGAVLARHCARSCAWVGEGRVEALRRVFEKRGHVKRPRPAARVGVGVQTFVSCGTHLMVECFGCIGSDVGGSAGGSGSGVDRARTSGVVCDSDDGYMEDGSTQDSGMRSTGAECNIGIGGCMLGVTCASMDSNGDDGTMQDDGTGSKDTGFSGTETPLGIGIGGSGSSVDSSRTFCMVRAGMDGTVGDGNMHESGMRSEDIGLDSTDQEHEEHDMHARRMAPHTSSQSSHSEASGVSSRAGELRQWEIHARARIDEQMRRPEAQATIRELARGAADIICRAPPFCTSRPL